MTIASRTAVAVPKSGQLFAQERETLEARVFFYAVFQALFGNEPTPAIAKLIDTDLLDHAAKLVGFSYPSGFVDQLCAAQEDTEELKREYTRLFIGPGKLPSPPWESVHVSSDRALFQESTLEVRGIYKANGFIPNLYPQVADDHIALELDFLGSLARRMDEVFAAGDARAFRIAAEVSREFLESHVLKWVSSFSGGLAADNADGFYAVAAQALVAFVEADAEVVKRMVDDDI